MNGYGENLLFHIAYEGRRSVEVIQMLLEGNPKKRTSHVKNNKGQLPINIVGYSNNAPVEVVKLLLGVSVGDRIEQLRLQGWRIGVEELVKDSKDLSVAVKIGGNGSFYIVIGIGHMDLEDKLEEQVWVLVT